VKRFLLLYKGPATPPNASHEGWPAWFHKLGGKLVDKGEPLRNGCALDGDGSTSESTTHLNGYSLIRATDIREALSLLCDHPYLPLGRDVCTYPGPASVELHLKKDRSTFDKES
jgi:hypothetical protein